MEFQHVLTIDPGKTASGWSYWKNLTEEELVPFATGVIRKDEYWEIVDSFQSLSLKFDIGIVFIESQEYYPSKSVAVRKGDIFKLAHVTGAIATALYLGGCPWPVFVKPTAWKGQLTKKVVKERVRRIISKYVEDNALPGQEYTITLRDHETDAIGIGFFLLGKLSGN